MKFSVGDRVRSTQAGHWSENLSGTVIQDNDVDWLVKFDGAEGKGHSDDGACFYFFEGDGDLQVLADEPAPINDEIEAIRGAVTAFEGIDIEARKRVMRYLDDRFETGLIY